MHIHTHLHSHYTFLILEVDVSAVKQSTCDIRIIVELRCAPLCRRVSMHAYVRMPTCVCAFVRVRMCIVAVKLTTEWAARTFNPGRFYIFTTFLIFGLCRARAVSTVVEQCNALQTDVTLFWDGFQADTGYTNTAYLSRLFSC